MLDFKLAFLCTFYVLIEYEDFIFGKKIMYSSFKKEPAPLFIPLRASKSAKNHCMKL